MDAAGADAALERLGEMSLPDPRPPLERVIEHWAGDSHDDLPHSGETDGPASAQQGDSLPTRTYAAVPADSEQGQLPTVEDVAHADRRASMLPAAAPAADSQNTPFAGEDFDSLMHRLSLGQAVHCSPHRPLPRDVVRGSVAERILAVVDGEAERHEERLRVMEAEYEERLRTRESAHRAEVERMCRELLRDRLDAERGYERRLSQNKQSLKDSTSKLAREGLLSQVEGERSKEELESVYSDVAALKKLLFFWKKKNNVLKRAFDENERELYLATEKLRDYHKLHEQEVYRVHRFCGQLREKEMRSRWMVEELEAKGNDLKLEIIQLSQEQGRPPVEDSEQTSLPSDHQPADSVPRGLTSSPRRPQLRCAPPLAAPSPAQGPPPDLVARCQQLLGEGSQRRTGPVRPSPAADPTAEEAAALREGLRARDDQIDVALEAVRCRDATIAALVEQVEMQRKRLHEAEFKVFEPFQCADLVQEKSNLRRQMMDAQEIIFAMQRQLLDERRQAAEGRAKQADEELRVAKERKRRELEQHQMLRDRDAEIIRLESRLQDGSEADDVKAELRIVRLEHEKASIQDQIASLADEKTRLKQYVGTLGARLEKVLSKLEHRRARLRECEQATAAHALTPRQLPPRSCTPPHSSGSALPAATAFTSSSSQPPRRL
eukprot:TRINITY_DN3795_c0_g1_i1.p1 TRINITY_DN3795_c0_g1~~TRINITY_DN3795_c0_g1_i1.p1  ORF type:complete len:693 (+),score=279.47 TRINITY_DN3795_c0_g1_i1:90-2081(+)